MQERRIERERETRARETSRQIGDERRREKEDERGREERMSTRRTATGIHRDVRKGA